jgi:transcriptional regulator with XRE-family HTH domain
MALSFGTRLRAQRERRQISLNSIVEQTKISLSLLEGLERDDVSHWPAGIFRRAFIRTYAHIIGLEPDATVREFLELHPDPAEVIAAGAVLPEAAAQNQSPPTRLRYFLRSAIGFLRPGSAPKRVEGANVPAAQAPEPLEPTLSAVADLCTELGRVMNSRELLPLLERVAGILDATGLIVWVSDPLGTSLTPALSYGYSEQVLVHVPSIGSDADNATATAFRSAQARIVRGSDLANGALVAPLMTRDGCIGVFAAELRRGAEQRESTRALATIVAAQLATLVGFSPLAEVAHAGDTCDTGTSPNAPS